MGKKNREYLQEKCGMPLELIESEEDWAGATLRQPGMN